MATIQGVYVALFGRPADPTGLAYFSGVTKNGADLSGIGDLASTQEYKDRFKDQSNVAIVNSIYQSLFNRDAESAGLNFFVDALNKGTLNIKNIAIAILDGAQNADKTTAANKITAADNFTKAIDTPVEIGAYTGNNAAAAGRAFLAQVNANASSIPTAAATDAAVANIASISTGGVTLSVTAAQEVSTTATDAKQKSTAGDDTINVDKIVPSASASNAVTSVAKIDGGFGNDTVTLKTAGTNGTNAVTTTPGTGGLNATINATPDYVNVEKIAVTAVGGNGGDKTGVNGGNGGNGDISLDLSKATALKELVNDSSTKGTAGAGTGSGTVGTAGTASVAFTNVADNVKLGLKGTITDTTAFTFKTAQTGTTTLALDKVKTASDLTITNGAAKIALTTVNGSELTSFKSADVKEIAVTGSGDLKFAIAAATNKLATFDASALTGGKLDLNVSTGSVAIKITGTNAADVITLNNSATGDAAKDVIVYNKAEASNFAVAESITSFQAASDKIDLKAFGLTKAGIATIGNATNDAGVFGTNSVGVFKETTVAGGSTSVAATWVFVDSNNDGKLNLASDFAVKLVGDVALTADNFILS